MINYGVAILAPPTNNYPLSTTQLSFSPAGCLFIISLHLEKLIHLQCFFFKTPASVRRASGVVKNSVLGVVKNSASGVVKNSASGVVKNSV